MMFKWLSLFGLLLFAHPFGLEWDDEVESPFETLVAMAEKAALMEFDDSFGHHGKPAKYKTSEGVVHPWNKAEEENDDDDDLEMLTIMESIPEMCPLCAQEGHSLGHDEHKIVLAKLRRKMIEESKGKDKPKKEKKREESCALCRAEGSNANHKEHSALIKEAKSCPLCRAEGHILNHAKHHKCPLCVAEGSTVHHAHHQLLLSLAESFELSSSTKEKKEEKNVHPYAIKFDIDLDFDGMMDENPEFGMLAMKVMPPRDFSIRLGEPKDPIDHDDDEKDEEEESLWDRIVKNIKDLLGISQTASDDSEPGEAAGTLAVIILLFVGCMLLSLGLIELLSVFLGDDAGLDSDYSRLAANEEDQMILDMEEQKGSRGAIQL